MSSGLYSGVSGLALGIGLYRNVSGLWGGASGLIDGFGGAGFSPASLFAAGEPGAWYDPSDFSTLFQDSAGTTPVTAVAQPVGLMLDKSQGLVLGPELVTNGGFATDTAWTKGAGWTITGGAAVATSVAAFGELSQAAGVAIGFYRVTLNVTVSAGAGFIRLGSVGNIGNFNATGSYSFILQCGAAGSSVRVLADSGGFTGTIDNISVKLLPGNHAFQSTAGQRPTLGRNPTTGRLNLLTFTEQFDNAAWTKTNTTVTADNTTAPDGTLTADRIVENSSAGTHNIIQSATPTVVNGAPYVLTVRVKPNTRNIVYVQSEAAGTGFGGAFVTLTGAGTVSNYFNGLSSGVSVSALPDGWYLITLQYTATTTSGRIVVGMAATAGTQSYTGDGTSSLWFWGFQHQTGTIATAYQRVVSSFDVTEAGKPDLYYVNFDGTDDGMLTNTITPGIDKAQVFSGVRKLADATAGIIVESSTDVDANAGTIILFTNPNTYGAKLRGSSNPSAVIAPTSYPVPNTSILTATGDIAADSNVLRINGTQVASSTADQGTGNYLAYPLYIGRRAGTTLPFNGNVYSMIVRFGANLTADQIAATEAWVNTKTAALPVDYYYLQTATGDQLVDGNGDDLYSLPIFG